MSDARALAAAYGVRVELADLGDWAPVTLVAEYDPDGPVIRINERTLWRTLRQAQGDNGRAQGDNGRAQGDNGGRPQRSDAASPDVTLSLSKGAPQTDAVDRAIAHELYHHREAIGEVARIADRAARERAADAFADDLVRAR